jgi:hypothetical protein
VPEGVHILPSHSLLRKINLVLSLGLGLSAAFSRIEKPWPTLPAQVFSVIWEFLLAGGISYFFLSTVFSPRGLETVMTLHESIVDSSGRRKK